MKVLGLSLVTNCVAHSHGRSAKEAYMLTQNMKIKRAKKNELNDESIRANHAEVLEAGNKMSKHMQTLVEKIVGMMVEFSKE